MSFQSFILTSNAIIAVVDNKQYHVGSDHMNFNKLKEAYKSGDSEEFVKLVNVEQHLNEEFSKAMDTLSSEDRVGVKVVNGEIYLDGEPLSNCGEAMHVISDCIKRMLSEGFNIDPMLKFVERLMKNTSRNSVQQLFKFLEVCGLSITEDGCFLAYKSVKDNYLDKYSGRFDNTPGAVHEVPRNKVDDNPHHGCSYGFHVGALKYAGPGGYYNASGDKVVICKVDPADVVSVPEDHSFQKLRTCKYTVVGDFQGELKSAVYSGEVGEPYTSTSNANSNIPQRGEVVNSPSEMLIDSMYEFDYDNNRRYGVLMQKVSDVLMFEMVDPDMADNESEIFSTLGISNIREYDGDMTDFDWQNECLYACDNDDYDDEDDDEDDCDCDECECDCNECHDSDDIW